MGQRFARGWKYTPERTGQTGVIFDISSTWLTCSLHNLTPLPSRLLAPGPDSLRIGFVKWPLLSRTAKKTRQQKHPNTVVLCLVATPFDAVARKDESCAELFTHLCILITMGFYVCMHVAGRKLLAHPRHPHPHEARRGGRRVNLRLLLLLLLVWRLVLMWLLLAVLHGRPSRNRIWPSHPRVSADVGGEVIPQQTATAAGTGTGTGTTACTRTGGHPLHSLETPRQGWIEDISRRRHGKACAKRGDGNNRNQLLVWVLANSKQNETALINICPRVRKS